MGQENLHLQVFLWDIQNNELVDGEIILDGENINEDAVDERAKKGIFLSFQYPEEIPGLTVEDFLRTAKEAVTGEKQYLMQFHNELVEKMENFTLILNMRIDI